MSGSFGFVVGIYRFGDKLLVFEFLGERIASLTRESGYEFRGDCVGIFLQFALPDYDRIPAGLLKKTYVLAIALLVAFELRYPVLEIALGGRGMLATGVSMPEAAVYEYDCLIARKNDVGPAG